MGEDIFFFGSGFSKSLIPQYPTLRELSKYIKNELCYEKGSVKEHFQNEVPNKFHNDIETLLAYLSSKLPYKTDVQISMDEALYKDITSKIAKYFYDLRKQLKVDYNENNIKEFAKYILDNKITCITLNYDLILEDLLYKNTPETYQQYNKNYSVFYKIPITELANRIPDGGSGGAFSDYEKDDDRTEILEIIKLHGSINWLSSGQTNDPIYCETETEQEQKKEYLKTDLNTFIVPPVLDKQSQYNNIILRALWKKAFNTLRTANNIYIYGFSFPLTDFSIKFLFQSALKNNNHYKIYIINTNTNLDNLKNRYFDVFEEDKCDFSCCVEKNQLNTLLGLLKNLGIIK